MAFQKLRSALFGAEARPTSRILTVEAYDAAERRGMVGSSNRIIEACQAVTFAAVGYPFRIASTEEAGRFVDVMQDGRSEATVRDILRGLTGAELDLMERVAKKVAHMTERLYGRRQVPRASMLRALNIVRHIRYLREPSDAVVLEIGSGSGYVGALLIELGYRYVSVDIAQAFYIYQSHLFDAMADGQFLELATDQRSFSSLSDLTSWKAVHVPWWKFVTGQGESSVQVDIVTCNHALCEMHHNALAYNTLQAAKMLKGDDDRFFLMEGWGSTIHHPIWHAGRALSKAGLCFAHNDIFSTVLVRTDSAHAGSALNLQSKEGDGETKYHPPIFVDPAGIVGGKILNSREKTSEAARSGLADLDARLRTVLGREELRTDDEIFAESVDAPL